jgi:hypothetical protein
MATLVCISTLFICVISLSFLYNSLSKKLDELTMEIAKIHFSMASLWLDRSTTIRENNLSDHFPDASKMAN